MKTTGKPHDLGQSLWPNNITRGLLTSGTPARYIDEVSVTGLTSNPTIFDHVIANTDFYGEAIGEKAASWISGVALFSELAVEDLGRKARTLLLKLEQHGWVKLPARRQVRPTGCPRSLPWSWRWTPRPSAAPALSTAIPHPAR